MKNYTIAAALSGISALCAVSQSNAVEYTTARPLAQVVTTPVKPCGNFSQILVHTIAWGADEATILANGGVVETKGRERFSVTQQGSIFAKEGLSVRLTPEDSVPKQLEEFLSCQTPFLRMTDGMLAQAGDVLARLPTQVAYMLSFSVGSDVMVCRDRIKVLSDVKKFVTQVYGPHLNFAARQFKDAHMDLKNMQIVYVKDITEGDAASQYPALALSKDQSIDCAFVIAPDDADLMGGKGEYSVKGSWKVMSTQTCDTCIGDFYL